MDRFFGPTAAATTNPFARKELPTTSAADGLGEGVRAIKVPLEDLMKSYVVSYAGLLGDHRNGDNQMSRESSDEASCSESDDENDSEPAGELEEEDIDKEEKEEKSEKERGKKKRKKPKKTVVKRDRVGDYDLEDPFIDDDEVAVAYESIFDLLHGAEDEEAEDQEEKKKTRRGENDDDKPPLREFYVYRGEMQVEVVSKLKGRKQSKKKENSGDETPNEEAPKRTKKSKKPVDVSAGGEVKTKKVKQKKEKAPKKEPIVAEKPMSTLERILSLEAKLDVPLPKQQSSTEESAKGTPEKSKRNVVDYDRLFAELETRLSLEAWKAQAKSMTSFEPSKFPSALRDLTGSLAICYLRAAAPHHSHIEESLFEELGRMVPYTAMSLRKVTFKKILPLFFQEIQKKLESLYVAFTNESQQLAVPSNSQPEPASQEDLGASQLNNPASKSRLRFNEVTRQLIYEIVRFELDSAYIEQSLRSFEPSDPTAPLPKLPGEMLLRKSIYQKIFKALPSHLCEFTTTNEISLQYGQQKRKIERKVLKDHGVEAPVEGLGEKRKAPQPSALSLHEPIAAADATLESAPKRLDLQPTSTTSQDQRNMFAQMLFSTENVPQN